MNDTKHWVVMYHNKASDIDKPIFVCHSEDDAKAKANNAAVERADKANAKRHEAYTAGEAVPCKFDSTYFAGHYWIEEVG